MAEFIRYLSSSIYGNVFLYKYEGQMAVCKNSSCWLMSRNRNESGHVTHENPILEGEIMSTLSPHSSIVKFIDQRTVTAKDDGKEYHQLVFEYLPGGDMYDYVKAHERRVKNAFAWVPKMKNYIRQVLKGVVHLHEAGVAHLDLSCENILLDADYQNVKICDLGAAVRVADCDTNQDLSQRGKKFYMAPEIATQRSPKEIDLYKCDAWSFGVCIWIMMFNQPFVNIANWTDPNFSYVDNIQSIV